MIRYTPAVTIVAAWINADTGVGPSMASGNQVCSPICADFPTAPIIIHIPIASKSSGDVLATVGTIANTVGKSNDPNPIRIMNIPTATPKSPTLFTTIAFIAALFAWIRVNQKFINKNEHSPTPSHPINTCT